MKTRRYLALGLLALSSPLRAQANIDVEFKNPERFSDASDRGFGSGSSESVLERLREEFQAQAAKYLTEGQSLQIEVLDIDLAGHYWPGAAPGREDIRVLTGVTWPRIHFRYELRQGDEVLRSGEAKLSDMNYLSEVYSRTRLQPLYHERQLIDEWFAAEFGPEA